MSKNNTLFQNQVQENLQKGRVQRALTPAPNNYQIPPAGLCPPHILYSCSSGNTHNVYIYPKYDNLLCQSENT
jgi:hypothetical protein